VRQRNVLFGELGLYGLDYDIVNGLWEFVEADEVSNEVVDVGAFCD
jgi:hypothetical protein